MPKTLTLELEAKIIADLGRGRHDIYKGGTTGGFLGTYTRTRWPHFDNIDETLSTIESLLSENWYTQNYVAESRLLSQLPQMVGAASDPKWLTKIQDAIQRAIRNDAKKVIEQLALLPSGWLPTQ